LAGLIPVIGLPASFGDVRKLFVTISIASILFSVLALASGQFDRGRISLEGGAFGNTNDLAQVILLGIPFQVFGLVEHRRNPLVAGFLSLALLPAGLVLLKTGSRSVVVASFVMFMFLFFRVSLAAKINMAVLAGLILVAGLLLLPRTTLLRYMTLFRSTSAQTASADDYETEMSAMESSEGRRQLLKDSLMYTAKHPIFGVGPGNFAVVRGLDREKEGITGSWKVSHNAYTQISSECGIPALIFYLLALGSTFFTIRKAVGHQQGLNLPVSISIRRAALALQVSLISFIVCAFFLSIAYQPQVLFVVALAIVLERVSAEERQKLNADPTIALPTPTVPQKFAYSVLPR
jgi:O-antigen ligase